MPICVRRAMGTTMAKKRFPLCPTDEFGPGERRLFQVEDKEIGLFNLAGEFYALLNYCPHYGGALCEGPVTGTTLPTRAFRYEYGHAGAILRCAWHGWEFEIASGRCLVDERLRARRYEVQVEEGEVVLYV